MAYLSIMQMNQAQNQWEAEMAYRQAQDAYNYQLQAEEAAEKEKQYAIEYSYQVHDWETYGSLTGMNVSYMKQYDAATLAKKSSSGRSSATSDIDETEIAKKLGLPGAADVTITRKQGTVIPNNFINPSNTLMAMRNKNVFSNGKTLL